MTPEEISEGLKALAAAFPNDTTLQNEQTVAAYADRLKWAHPDDFKEAIGWVIDNCTWFPKIAEVRGAAEMFAARRMEKEDSQKRKMLPVASEEKIHEQQQRFKDMLSGKIKLPEPSWVKKSEAKQT